MTIIPRGRALGVTLYLPEEDKYSLSKSSLESSISTLFGGRLAEEMTLGPDYVTTGASDMACNFFSFSMRISFARW